MGMDGEAVICRGMGETVRVVHNTCVFHRPYAAKQELCAAAPLSRNRHGEAGVSSFSAYIFSVGNAELPVIPAIPAVSDTMWLLLERLKQVGTTDHVCCMRARVEYVTVIPAEAAELLDFACRNFLFAGHLGHHL